MYLKYKITQEDLDRGRAQGTDGVGIVTTTGISTNTAGTVSSNFYETSNFISVPDHIIGVNKILSDTVLFQVECLVLSINCF